MLDKLSLGEDSYRYTPSQPHPQWGRTYQAKRIRPKYAPADSPLREWVVVDPEGRTVARAKTLEEAEEAIRESIRAFARFRSSLPDG